MKEIFRRKNTEFKRRIGNARFKALEPFYRPTEADIRAKEEGDQPIRKHAKTKI